MFGRFMPREGRFFDFFNAHAEQVVLAAQQLVALLLELQALPLSTLVGGPDLA